MRSLKFWYILLSVLQGVKLSFTDKMFLTYFQSNLSTNVSKHNFLGVWGGVQELWVNIKGKFFQATKLSVLSYCKKT